MSVNNNLEAQKANPENLIVLVKKLEYTELPDLSNIIGHVTGDVRRKQFELSQSGKSADGRDASLTKLIEVIKFKLIFQLCSLIYIYRLVMEWRWKNVNN